MKNERIEKRHTMQTVKNKQAGMIIKISGKMDFKARMEKKQETS